MKIEARSSRTSQKFFPHLQLEVKPNDLYMCLKPLICTAAVRGKRVYSSCGSRREYYDATSFSNTQLLLEIWKELLKRSNSR